MMMMMMMIIIIIIIIQWVLTCRLNSTSAYYKANIKTQIQHKNGTNTQKQSTKPTKHKQYITRKQFKKLLGKKAPNPLPPKHIHQLI